MESFKPILVSILMILVSFFNPSFCDPLDTLIHDYVNNKISSDPTTLRTGVIRHLSLPSVNSSTIQLAVVRLRTGSLWARGKNISAFQIPPMIIPIPYVKRLVLVTSDLGHNLSSHYTPPRGCPVMGLAVYSATTTAFLSNTSIDVNVAGVPMVITFDNLKMMMQCVLLGLVNMGLGERSSGRCPSPVSDRFTAKGTLRLRCGIRDE